MAILLALLNEEDKPFTPKLKTLVGDSTVFVKYEKINTINEILIYCNKRKITGVFSTNTVLLSKLLLLKGKPKNSPSLSNYAGSYIEYSGIEFIFISPVEHLQKISYGTFISRRYISKLTLKDSWKNIPKFSFIIVTPENFEDIFRNYEQASLLSVDIETIQEDLQIRCISYTAVFINKYTGSITTHSCVLPIDSVYALTMMRNLNWNIKCAKILQNGKYDCAYLARYNAPLYNYLWDTANLFHCWYSELPKDLAFLGAFFIREVMYWKDLANTEDLYEYYKYNALDSWTTAFVFIQMIMEMPQWAIENYKMEFPLVFPCHMCEMLGIKQDNNIRSEELKKIELEIEKDNISLSKMVSVYPQIYNVNSTPQNKAFRVIIGCGDLSSSDEINLKKMSTRHPLNKRIINKILDIRGNRKLASTYLCEGKDLNGRILYSLNPHGTDTGRLASREHHFWCGLQIQNITRGKEVKQMFIADEGFRFAEVDLSQAETRGTAYISGDSKLIGAINSGRDFHATNASSFFGVPYETIFCDSTGKVVDKVLRDLAKRTNHGATYLMGPQVLLDTMGDEKVWQAKKLLNLPVNWSLLQVTTYLIDCFHKTYPTLSTVFYPGVVSDVITTNKLVGGNGWTRYCFDNPQRDKRAKNSYVAHVPQSLNAMQLNKAFMKVFYQISLNPEHSNNFKLIAQIHDSILFQFRFGHSYLCDLVKSCMEIPCTIKGYDGVKRTFTVPADIKAGFENKGAISWADTE